MTAKFIITESATLDLEEIADYIAEQSDFDKAEKVLVRINSKFSQLTNFPRLGRLRNDIAEGIRSLSVERYLILYIQTGQNIEILRVVSGYQDLSSLFD